MSRAEPYEKQTDDSGRWSEIVHQYVSSIQFGTIQITVHDSRVTQIEKTEKTRLDNPKNAKQITKITEADRKPEVPKVNLYRNYENETTQRGTKRSRPEEKS